MKTRPDPSTKQYFKCLSCPKFKVECGGKPTRNLSLKEWCEYICDVMDIFHIKSSYVVEKADVSEKTMEKIRALNYENDIMRGTARRIEQAVLGDVGIYACCMDYDIAKIEELQKKIEKLEKDNERYEKIIDRYMS